ncbi:hypothetical protein UFOVP46_35 [uncultured Caudovirales phage]|uniref:CBM-cenC domain-containing protein n=1 Tax=uncultured Caudovirales phage TaxID=2100421 RepID=A0A6J5KTS3_9CAUD|nr:hypothetical protein UFOVP46_35 [uncultured Caudovirales phage]
MPKYGNTFYQQGYYGQKSALLYSVSPFFATAIDYGLVSLTWAAPQGSFIGARLVRNQDAFAETPEDGVIIWSEYTTTSSLSRSTFLDGYDNLEDSDPLNDIAIVSGRYAYYRMWIQKMDSTWVVAGDTFTIVPKNHITKANHTDDVTSTHDKVMDLLPRVFTSATHSPIDEVDPDSAISTFLEGFSFTLDEMLTVADLVKPEISGRNMSPILVSLRANELGLTSEAALNLKLQKRLNREAVYMYSRKGTLGALKTLVESVTGFSTTLTSSPNLMLTNQDSTFNKSIGSWLPIGNCTIALEQAVVPPTAEPLATELSYTAKVVVGTSGSKVSNGADTPVTKGIPVTSGTAYSFSFYCKSGGTVALTSNIRWYNYLGAEITTTQTPVSGSATTSWTKSTATFTAPTGAAYASVEITFGATGTVWLDMCQFSNSSITSYHEARGVDIFLLPKKYNYIENPSFTPFSDEDSDWVVSVGSAGTFVTPTTLPNVSDGSHMFSVALANGSNSSITAVSDAGVVSTGTYYTFSIYGQTASGTESMSLNIAAHDIADGYLTATNSVPVVLTTTWDRHQVTVFVPDTFSAATTYFTVSLSGTTTGKTIHLDAAQLEPYFYATDYFDGDLAGFGAVWGAGANDSPSYQYPEKSIKIIRLIDEVNKFIPKNTPWTITTYGGLEASGIS